MPAYGLCEFCGEEFMWGRTTKSGRPMPLDPVPCEDGNVAIYTDATGRLNARVLKKGETPERWERLVKPHFATCPKYAQVMAARRQRKASPGQLAPTQQPLPPNVISIRTARNRRKP